ncbi:hypothetical protein BELL_0882g00040 [Botrytis elliptica]|uniref:Uncharacterized protein n=1 Tax=Botrytis elliptica TaxID=278938 RepID=A0A4Z1JEC9_9HELO|nr:hypothetical protein BELL_0882g00040 [Botrytis elliptica]
MSAELNLIRDNFHESHGIGKIDQYFAFVIMKEMPGKDSFTSSIVLNPYSQDSHWFQCTVSLTTLSASQ